MGLRVFLLLGAQHKMRLDLHILPDHRRIGVLSATHAEIQPLHGASNVKCGAAALRLERHVQAHWLGYAAQRQHPVGNNLAALLMKCRRNEMRLRVFGDVEEIRPGQGAVTIVVARLGGSQINGDVEFR